MYYQSGPSAVFTNSLWHDFEQVGDVVSVEHPNFTHWGIRIGPNRIIAASKRFKVICEVTDEVFSGGGLLNRHPLQGMIDRTAITKAARSRLGERYDMVFSNCEHFVSWVVNGKPESPQVKYWVSTIIAGAAIGFTATALMRQK